MQVIELDDDKSKNNTAFEFANIPQDLAECVSVFQNGGVVIFPTDTVYGLACSAFNVDAIRRIYEMKGRDYKKSLPIFLGQAQQLPLVAKEIPKELDKLIGSFWPGPLTVVLKTSERAIAVSRGRDTIAVRIPDHGVVRKILDLKQIPLVVTSANKSGAGSLHLGSEVISTFEDKVDLILDGGECENGIESSVVDATHFPFTLLREGAISKERLQDALGF